MMLSLTRDPSGRFAPLKALCLALCLYPLLLLAVRWGLRDLGGRPITEAIHVSGDWTVRFLVLTLAVTPARAVLDWSRVLLLRRMLGVTTACYAALHLVLYMLDQKWDLWIVGREIVLRVYLTIGFVALLGLIALAVTSTDGWQKKLRGRWKQLHSLVFPIAVLGILHFYMQSKSNVSDAVVYSGYVFWLLLWRRLSRPQQGRLNWLPAIAVGAAVLTAIAEALWYGLATRLSGWRVLAANLNPEMDPRPAVLVLLAGLGVWGLAALRRALRRRMRAAA
jgi:sulfoxide reductase heme-binding subunit YedZ